MNNLQILDNFMPIWAHFPIFINNFIHKTHFHYFFCIFDACFCNADILFAPLRLGLGPKNVNGQF